MHCFTSCGIWKPHTRTCNVAKFRNFMRSNSAITPLQKQMKKEGESAVDMTTVTRWSKKFRFSYKNLDNQVISGWPITLDSEARSKAIVVNTISSTRRVSGGFGIWQRNSSPSRPWQKHSRAAKSCFICNQNMAKLWTQPSRKLCFVAMYLEKKKNSQQNFRR